MTAQMDMASLAGVGHLPVLTSSGLGTIHPMFAIWDFMPHLRGEHDIYKSGLHPTEESITISFTPLV